MCTTSQWRRKKVNASPLIFKLKIMERKRISEKIKVIGFGGCGLNSVDQMIETGIHGVDYAVCHYDPCCFIDKDIPTKIILDSHRSPNIDVEAIANTLFDDGTKMAFIVAGMGGYFGTIVAPLLAEAAKNRGILTVGVFTIPFLFEMPSRITKALDVIEDMYKKVDALIVLNNESLKDLFPDFSLVYSFSIINEVLTMIVKNIAEIITVKGLVNRDFDDVVYIMKDSGVALVGYGFGSGENRLKKAIDEALNSPLLNNNDIFEAKRVLFHISSKEDPKSILKELDELECLFERFERHVKILWGYSVDESLTDYEVKFSFVATGFEHDEIPSMSVLWD